MSNYSPEGAHKSSNTETWQLAQSLMKRLFKLYKAQLQSDLWPKNFMVQGKEPISGLYTMLYEEGDLPPSVSYEAIDDNSRLLVEKTLDTDSIRLLRDASAPIAEVVKTYCDSIFATESIAHLPAMVYRAAEVDGRWVLVYGNAFIERFTGQKVGQFLGPHAHRDLTEFIYSEDLTTVLAIYDRTKTTVQSAQLDYRMKNASGHYVGVTEYVRFSERRGLKQSTSIVIPQGETELPTKALDLYQEISIVAQDVGLQTGQSFLEHFCRRLDLLCGAKRMVLVWPQKLGWWQTVVVAESSVIFPNYDFLIDDASMLETYAFNRQTSSYRSLDLLVESHRYISVVPLQSPRETITACLILASDTELSNEAQLKQYIELFVVRVLREIQQSQAVHKLDHQNHLLRQQKQQLTELVNLLGKLELVQCENEFIHLVDLSLKKAFSLSSRAWCFWASGEWMQAHLPETDQREWYFTADVITDAALLRQLENVRRTDILQVFKANQTVVWPIGLCQAGYLSLLLDFSMSIPDVELMQFAKNSISLALQALKQRQILRTQAMTDSLTGLGNRIQLHEWMKVELESQEPAALLLFDLNRFKEINDSFGHQFGDKLLREIGPRIESALTYEHYFLARLGGDEFALYLSGVEEHQAFDLAYAIHRALARPYLIDQLTFQVEASVGLAFKAPEHCDSHELLRHADVAMYASKTTGRKVVDYSLELDHRTPHKIAVLSELDNAISVGQIFVVYQPLMDAKTGGVGGLEALVRWLHPEYGYLSPAEFIPISEMGEGIRKITDFVIQQSLAKMLEWRTIVPNLHVAVNLSPRVLLNKQFPKDLTKLLNHYACPADVLVFELTESTLLIDPDRAIEIIKELALVGVKVEIDDFGTGFSSLSYLKQLPISALKIDRSFIMDLNRDDSDQVIVSSTINMAHSLGLKTVAEGVEDEATLMHLLRLGCDMIQGYYYAKPMPAERVSLWLHRNK